MPADFHKLSQHGQTLLSWFGLERSETGSDATEPDQPPPAKEQGAHPQARQLEELVQFITAQRLEVSAASLAVAFNYLNGTDSRLVRAVERRLNAGEPLTPAWLEEQLGDNGRAEDIAVLNQLIQRLENSIDELATTSRDAQSATSEYQIALKEHVSDLEHVSKAGDVITELASIAKVMVRRTRDLEREMIRSEAQTRALRRRLNEARRVSEIDHLTGLPNRRSFDSTYEEIYLQAYGESEPLCVAFCDIDHFKSINDQHGHDAGDRVLKLVAASFAAISNDNCHVARHGGEEFVMLMRGLRLEEAFRKLDSLRAQLSQRRLVNRSTNEPFGQISFSAGIADVFTCGDPRLALRAADSALLRAKRMGRNRIEIAEPEDCLPRFAEKTAA